MRKCPSPLLGAPAWAAVRITRPSSRKCWRPVRWRRSSTPGASWCALTTGPPGAPREEEEEEASPNQLESDTSIHGLPRRGVFPETEFPSFVGVGLLGNLLELWRCGRIVPLETTLRLRGARIANFRTPCPNDPQYFVPGDATSGNRFCPTRNRLRTTISFSCYPVWQPYINTRHTVGKH